MAKRPLHDWMRRYIRHEMTRVTGALTDGIEGRALLKDAADLIADLIKGGAECEGRCNPGLPLKQVSMLDYSVLSVDSNGTSLPMSSIEQEQYLPSEPFGDMP